MPFPWLPAQLHGLAEKPLTGPGGKADYLPGLKETDQPTFPSGMREGRRGSVMCSQPE